MAARRESRSNHADQDGSPAAATETEAVEAEAAGTTAAEDAPDEDVPMNRAERRAKAKGKHGTQVQPPAGKIVPGRANQAHGHRSYANRRSGG